MSILIINEIEDLADKDCYCTADQQTGKDPSICKSCEAGNAINEIYTLIYEKYSELSIKGE